MSDVYFVDFQKRKLISKMEEPPEPSSIEKYSYFSDLIDQGLTQVFVNNSSNKAKLPSSYKNRPAVPINWSHKFGISNFSYDAYGVRGTLSFSKKPFYVELPWSSIWMMHRPGEEAETMKVWQNDAPDGTEFKEE